MSRAEPPCLYRVRTPTSRPRPRATPAASRDRSAVSSSSDRRRRRSTSSALPRSERPRRGRRARPGDGAARGGGARGDRPRQRGLLRDTRAGVDADGARALRGRRPAGAPAPRSLVRRRPLLPPAAPRGPLARARGDALPPGPPRGRGRLPDAAERERRGRPLLRPEEGGRGEHAALHGVLRRARSSGRSRRTASRPPAAGRSSSSRWPSTGRSGRRGSRGDSRAWPRGSASRGPSAPPSSCGWSAVAEPGSAREWAVALFRRSVLKQRKLAEVVEMLGPTAGLRCLDLGSDNGVVSLLLRERGGSWASGDLTEEAVGSIRSLVGEDVHLVRGDRLPFADATFDRVAVVDMLEHVPDEAAFAAELARVTKPGGLLVVNTPTSSGRSCAGCATPSARPTRSTATSAPATPPSGCGSCSRPPSRSSAIHLLALLLRGGGHCPQLGDGAAGEEVLGQGDGGDGRRPRPTPEGVPRVLRGLPVRVGGDAARRARPGLGLHADRDPEAAGRQSRRREAALDRRARGL